MLRTRLHAPASVKLGLAIERARLVVLVGCTSKDLIRLGFCVGKSHRVLVV